MSASELEAIFQAQDAILERVQEQCRECFRPRMLARNAADAVVAGEVELEDAASELAEDISRKCKLGQGVIGGCAGNTTVCGYGGRELTPTEQIDLQLLLHSGPPVEG